MRKEKNDMEIRELDAEELRAAVLILLKKIQKESFEAELKDLVSRKAVCKTSKIIKLDPFIDSNGLIRVGGRLQLADLSEDSKHQIILPHYHPLVDLIIKKIHENNKHCGPAILRERFWITHGRRTVKKVLNKCLICKHYYPKACSQKMAPLPYERIQPGCFVNVGLDFMGPVYLKVDKGTRKGYVLLFVCGNSRALHLELCNNMKTPEFLMAFKRMISRRGVCDNIFSDNQTSFHKADKILKTTLWKTLIREKCNENLPTLE